MFSVNLDIILLLLGGVVAIPLQEKNKHICIKRSKILNKNETG